VILNKLHSGFGVGPTINPCTKVRSVKFLGTLDMELAYWYRV